MNRVLLQLGLLLLALRVAHAQGPAGNAPARPPFPPTAPSPAAAYRTVVTFRMLLATNESGRAQWLALRTPGQRQLLEGTITEFLTLSAGERETRLQTLLLRWCLPPLMSLSAADRAARLAQIPEPDRRLLESKLKTWGILPQAIRQDLLDNQLAISVFASSGSSGGEGALRSLSPEKRKELEEQFKRLNELPDPRREQILANFQKFFEMPSTEQSKALRKLTPVERQQMERTLTVFEILPPGQRQQAVEGFKKFAELSPADRAAFLKSAERWQTMNDTEREKWRRTVNQLRVIQPPHPGRRAASLAGNSN